MFTKTVLNGDKEPETFEVDKYIFRYLTQLELAIYARDYTLLEELYPHRFKGEQIELT